MGTRVPKKKKKKDTDGDNIEAIIARDAAWGGCIGGSNANRAARDRRLLIRMLLDMARKVTS